MLLMRLNEEIKTPKFRQILVQIRRKIENRTLLPGEKLPSTRVLADKLGVHRSTVALAYQELWSLGFIDLPRGTNPRVRNRRQVATAAHRDGEGIINWEKTSSAAVDDIYQNYLIRQSAPSANNGSTLINFNRLTMDYRLFPLEHFRSCLNRVMKKQGAALMDYGNVTGFPPLREYLAHHLQQHGIAVTSDEILVTCGSQQAIDLVLRMIAAPGKTIVVEAPTYSHLLPLIRLNGLKPLEIPVRGDGMDLSVLERTIAKADPALIYTMPNFQNPSGISTSQAHRERLLALSERHRIPILEDGFEEEMKYFGRVVLPIKSMDKNRLVFYCGTFSKVLFPGVRIGWITADRECIGRLTAIRGYSELSSSMILQAAMNQFCRSGYYDRHISKMHRVFRKRMQTALTTLRKHIAPEWAEWTEPSGGYLIWLKLKPVPSHVLDWRSLFASQGVAVSDGNLFFFSKTPDIYLRLSISTLNEEEIIEGIKRLSNAFRQAYTGRKS